MSNEIAKIEGLELDQNKLADIFQVKDAKRYNGERLQIVSLEYATGTYYEVEIKFYEIKDSVHNLYYVFINEFSDIKSSYFVNYDNALKFAKDYLLHRTQKYQEFLLRKQKRQNNAS